MIWWNIIISVNNICIWAINSPQRNEDHMTNYYICIEMHQFVLARSKLCFVCIEWGDWIICIIRNIRLYYSISIVCYMYKIRCLYLWCNDNWLLLCIFLDFIDVFVVVVGGWLLCFFLITWWSIDYLQCNIVVVLLFCCCVHSPFCNPKTKRWKFCC